MNTLPIYQPLSFPELSKLELLTEGVNDLNNFKLRLYALDENPIAQLQLYLKITGDNPPDQNLWLLSTPASSVYCQMLVPRTAYAREVTWQVGLPPNLPTELYVACSQVKSNVINVKRSQSV